MTIEEFKTKLDEYLGMIGTLSQIQDETWSESYNITYNAPSGFPIITYNMVRSKIHKMPYGWYESGTRTTNLPTLDPDTKANYELWAIKLAELNKKP
jgi:hypothetical protein